MDAPAAATTSWTPLVLLSGAAFLTVTLEMLPAGLLPELSADLGVAPSQVGWLVGVWALTIAVTSLPMARATRHLPPRLVLGGSLALVGVASILTALSPGFAGVVVGRLVSAVGHGLFWSVLVTYAVGVAPVGRESRAVSVVLAGPVLASLLGLPLGTALAAPAGWRPVVGGVAVALAVSGVLLAATLPGRSVRGGPAAPDESGPVQAGRSGRTERRLVVATVAASLTLVGHFAVFTFVSPLLTGTGGLPGDAVGPALLVFGGAGAAGLAATAGPSERRPWGTALVVMAGLGASLLLLATTPQGVLLWVLLGAWGLFLGAFPAAQQSAVVRAAPIAFRATAGALLVASFNGGVAVGSTLGGAVLEGAGLPVLPLVGGLVVLVSTGLTWVAVRRLSSSRTPVGRDGVVSR